MKPSPYFVAELDIRITEPYRTRVLQWLNLRHCKQVHAPESPSLGHVSSHTAVASPNPCRLKARVGKDGFVTPLTLTHDGVVYELVPKSLL